MGVLQENPRVRLWCILLTLARILRYSKTLLLRWPQPTKTAIVGNSSESKIAELRSELKTELKRATASPISLSEGCLALKCVRTAGSVSRGPFVRSLGVIKREDYLNWDLLRLAQTQANPRQIRSRWMNI